MRPQVVDQLLVLRQQPLQERQPCLLRGCTRCPIATSVMDGRLTGPPWPGVRGLEGRNDATPDGGAGGRWHASGLAGCARPARDPALSAGGLAATTDRPPEGGHGQAARHPPQRPAAQPGRLLPAPHLPEGGATWQQWHPPPARWPRPPSGSGRPYAPRARRPFPPGARLREVEIEAGTATVDLSGTALPATTGRPGRWPLGPGPHLTQFPTVQRVAVQAGPSPGRWPATAPGPDRPGRAGAPGPWSRGTG